MAREEEEPRIDREHFVRLGLWAIAGVASGCFPSLMEPSSPEGNGRLDARWRAPTGSLDPGLYPLGLGSSRDGYIRLPKGYSHKTAAPLALLLHGAGHDAHEWDGGFPIFDALGLVVLSVDSRASSWDVRYGDFGPDVAFIDAALVRSFELCHVDASRMAIAGFSDGASYALSLGLTNGDLFTHVLGFSPGFLATDARRGKPPVYLSHGSSDPILSVRFTRDLARDLRDAGHAVTYQEFDGGHVLPYAVGERGFRWFTEGTRTPTEGRLAP